MLVLALLSLAAAGPVDFPKEVAPVLQKYCLGCHGAPGAHINLASRQAMLDAKSIVSGDPSKSPLYSSIANGSMPPGGHLKPAEVEAIRLWIAQGATWPPDFAFTVPRKTTREVAAETEIANVARIHERILAHQAQPAAPYKVTIPNTTVAYDVLPIPGGDFQMGSPGSQGAADEKPQHPVHIDPFFMQAHEVTWDEYRLFMFAKQAGEIATKDDVVDAVSRPTRPYVEMSFGMGINGYPAISMTQHAANKYAEWLSSKTGEFYRLPTEAEWEYACRAGAATPFYFGSDASELGKYAWYAANSGGKYAKVATLKPNSWGLYDMLGNVMEWTLDAYAPYKPDAGADPWVKAVKPYPNSVRGGSWNDSADNVRCAARVASDPSWKQQDPQLPKSIWYETDAQWLGFRLVRPAKVPSAAEMYRYWNSGGEHDEQ